MVRTHGRELIVTELRRCHFRLGDELAYQRFIRLCLRHRVRPVVASRLAIWVLSREKGFREMRTISNCLHYECSRLHGGHRREGTR